MTEVWALAVSRPLAFGGWEFVLACGEVQKRMEWWPGDAHLTHQQRPYLSAPVLGAKGSAARAAAAALVGRLNDEEAA